MLTSAMELFCIRFHMCVFFLFFVFLLQVNAEMMRRMTLITWSLPIWIWSMPVVTSCFVWEKNKKGKKNLWNAFKRRCRIIVWAKAHCPFKIVLKW